MSVETLVKSGSGNGSGAGHDGLGADDGSGDAPDWEQWAEQMRGTGGYVLRRLGGSVFDVAPGVARGAYGGNMMPRPAGMPRQIGAMTMADVRIVPN